MIRTALHYARGQGPAHDNIQLKSLAKVSRSRAYASCGAYQCAALRRGARSVPLHDIRAARWLLIAPTNRGALLAS